MREIPERLPMPPHLHGMLVLDTANTNPHEVVGRVVCTCGNRDLGVEYVGEVVEDSGEGIYIRVRTDGKRSGVRFFTRCMSCKSQMMVFDSGEHGWDAMISRLGTEPDTGNRWPPGAPDGPVEEFGCPSCDSQLFQVGVEIQGESYADASNEGVEMTIDQWANGFGWINIRLTCIGCGWTSEILSYETM